MRRGPRLGIPELSSWILRVGVGVSVSVMGLGLLLSGLRGLPTVDQMTRAHGMRYRAVEIIGGILRGDGASVIALGIVLLILTPIARVAMSAVLFAVEERDALYAIITLLVLAMTLSSLLLLG